MASTTLFLRLFAAFALTLRASCIFILAPVYFYPSPATGTTPAAWQPLYDAIASNSNVDWQIIINPTTGPGSTTLCPGAAGNPDATVDYQAAIAKLNGYPNTLLLGYIETHHGTETIAQVEAQIDIYASWSSCSGVDVSIDGIFFDDFTNTTDTGNLVTASYASAISQYAYNNVPSLNTPVIFNPGSSITSQTSTFFNDADTIVDSEIPASSYSSPGTINSISSQQGGSWVLAKSAIIINQAPSTLNPQPWVHTMIANGVQAFYISADGNYQSLSATLLNELVAAVAAG